MFLCFSLFIYNNRINLDMELITTATHTVLALTFLPHTYYRKYVGTCRECTLEHLCVFNDNNTVNTKSSVSLGLNGCNKLRKDFQMFHVHYFFMCAWIYKASTIYGKEFPYAFENLSHEMAEGEEIYKDNNTNGLYTMVRNAMEFLFTKDHAPLYHFYYARFHDIKGVRYAAVYIWNIFKKHGLVTDKTEENIIGNGEV